LDGPKYLHLEVLYLVWQESHYLVIVEFKVTKFAVAFTMQLAGFVIFLSQEEALSFIDSFGFS
jgi:hypothetical protein